MIQHKIKDVANFFAGFIVIALIMIISYFTYVKIDLSEDNRFTLHDSTVKLMENLEDVVEFKIYLDGNHLPADLIKVRNSILETLEEFSDISDGYVEYEFINLYETLEDEKSIEKELNRFKKVGLTSIPFPFKNEKGEMEKRFASLCGEAFYNGRSIPIPLSRDQRSANKPEFYSKVIGNIEFELTNAVRKMTEDSIRNIGFLQGHFEHSNNEIGDLALSLYEYYNTGPAYLRDSIGNIKINALENIDLLIVSRPLETLVQKEQYVIDQYVMNGGKILWMLEPCAGAEVDSLYRHGFTFATPIDNQLNPLLFKYGLKLNPEIVEDLNCSQIPISTISLGQANTPKNYKWIYTPILKPLNTHIITNNLNPIRLEFAGTIDTLTNPNITYTPLIKTSGANRYKKIPARIGFRETVEGRVKPQTFKDSSKMVAVLAEGVFDSFFKNRISPSFTNNPASKFKSNSDSTAMIIIADSDIGITKRSFRGEELDLGTDPATYKVYDNKEFLINCCNYLLNDGDFIPTKSKSIKMRLLDDKLVKENKSFVKLLNIGLPILIILLISTVFIVFRKIRFSR